MENNYSVKKWDSSDVDMRPRLSRPWMVLVCDGGELYLAHDFRSKKLAQRAADWANSVVLDANADLELSMLKAGIDPDRAS